MEIRIEERLTGRTYRDRLLRRYGSLENLQAAARRGRGEARADFGDWKIFLSDERRLDEEFKVTRVTLLSTAEVERLTPRRLKLLERLNQMQAEVNVTTLADRVRRDKKNVSEDIKVLRRLGLVEARRQGRETLISPFSGEFHIILSGGKGVRAVPESS